MSRGACVVLYGSNDLSLDGVADSVEDALVEGGVISLGLAVSDKKSTLEQCFQ